MSTLVGRSAREAYTVCPSSLFPAKPGLIGSTSQPSLSKNCITRWLGRSGFALAPTRAIRFARRSSWAMASSDSRRMERLTPLGVTFFQKSADTFLCVAVRGQVVAHHLICQLERLIEGHFDLPIKSRFAPGNTLGRARRNLRR